MYRLLYLVTLLFCFASCSELFEYHPNEIRLEAHQQDLTAKNLRKLAAQAPQDTIRFVLMGDTQRFYDDVEDFVESAAKQNVAFAMHTGDITDFGMAQEFKWVHGLMSKLPYPYLTTIGNHDLLATGPAIYQQMYGPLDYTFEFGGYSFIVANTNGREYDFDRSIPNISWLRTALNKAKDNAIVIGHIPPFNGDFDPNLEDDFNSELQESGKVKLALFGHEHGHLTDEEYQDGIVFHVANSMKGRSYSIISLAKNYSNVEVVNF